MRKTAGFLFCLVALLFSSPSATAWAHNPPPGATPSPADEVSFDQKLNQQLPLDVILRDETGETVRMGDYFGQKPVILIFAYYNCTMLCTQALTDLAKNMKAMSFDAGKQFEVVTVSFDPKDTPQLAASKKATYLKLYGRAGAGKGWHFLTAKQPAIDSLTEAAGFHYAYDAAIGEYAHPTGVILLTPKGKISSYIFGIDYSAKDLRLGLVQASSEKIATPVDQFFLLCYHYNPVSGKYSLVINNVIRIAALITVLGLGSLLLGLFLFERWKHDQRTGGPEGGRWVSQ